jgi:two-component system sensor histidine kinase RegB
MNLRMGSSPHHGVVPTVLASQEAIRLRWLILIRWAAFASLAGIFLGANHLLALGLNVTFIVEILGVGCATNLFLAWVSRRSPEYPDLIAGLTLIFDVLLLTALLFISGGYTNPFSMVFVGYVALAAVVLDARWTWGVFGVSLVCFFTLFFLHIPLPQLAAHAHHIHHASASGVRTSGFSLHLHGMLVAFVCIGAIVAAFVTRMNREIAEQSRVISELREREDERKRLVSLATLTAGVTHELATPLATLSLIADELTRELKDSPRWGEDVALLQGEVQRCGAILQRMRAGNAELQGEAPREFSLAQLVRALQEEFVQTSVSVEFEGPIADDLLIYSLQHALMGSLQALIRNAIQASEAGDCVVCRTHVGVGEIKFTVEDAGMGMSAEVRARVGEPFFTSKEPGQGMGLGLYLTKLFAQQVGGTVHITSALGSGSVVELTVPKVMQV